MFGRKKKKPLETSGAAQAVTTAPQTDDALIAVITAAVAMSLGKPSNGIVIKSIRRAGQSAPAWGVRGRIEQVFNRL